MHAETLTVETRGRGFHEITAETQRIVSEVAAQRALCHVFIHHTSASLTITENADPDVLADLETVFAGLAPDGDPRYRHTAEGPDDMSAHVRSALTQTSMSIPVTDGRLQLGTWQGLFVWEHRRHAHRRKVTVTVVPG